MWRSHAVDQSSAFKDSPQEWGSHFPAPSTLSFGCGCMLKEYSSESHCEPKSLPLPKVTHLLGKQLICHGTSMSFASLRHDISGPSYWGTPIGSDQSACSWLNESFHPFLQLMFWRCTCCVRHFLGDVNRHLLASVWAPQ